MTMKRCIINSIFALGMVFPALSFAQDVPTLETLDLSGPVSSVQTQVTTYQYRGASVTRLPVKGPPDYTFDRNGLVSVETSYAYNSPTTVDGKRYFEYDENGRLVSIQGVNASGQLVSMENDVYDGPTRTRVEYDVDKAGNKRLRRETITDEDGGVVRRADYSVGSSGTVPAPYSTWSFDRAVEGSRIYFNGIYAREEIDVDAQGNVTRKLLRSDARTTEFQYIYEKDGLLRTATLTDTLQPLLHSWLLDYNDRGQVVEIRHTVGTLPPRVVSAVLYTYDSGTIGSKRSVSYDQNSQIQYTWTYTYDSCGNETGKTLTFPGFGESFSWRADYAGEKPTSVSVTNDSGILLEATNSAYDDLGRLSREIQIGRNGHVRSSYDQTLNEDGNPISYTATGVDGVFTSHYVKEYDSHGHLTLNTTYNADNSPLMSYSYRYQYDAYGNWIRVDTYTSNNQTEDYNRLTETRTRNIDYWPSASR